MSIVQYFDSVWFILRATTCKHDKPILWGQRKKKVQVQIPLGPTIFPLASQYRFIMFICCPEDDSNWMEAVSRKNCVTYDKWDTSATHWARRTEMIERKLNRRNCIRQWLITRILRFAQFPACVTKRLSTSNAVQWRQMFKKNKNYSLFRSFSSIVKQFYDEFLLSLHEHLAQFSLPTPLGEQANPLWHPQQKVTHVAYWFIFETSGINVFHTSL